MKRPIPQGVVPSKSAKVVVDNSPAWFDYVYARVSDYINDNKRWLFAIVFAAVVVVLVTVFGAWRWVVLVAFVFFVRFLIVDAVAEGVRRGRE